MDIILVKEPPLKSPAKRDINIEWWLAIARHKEIGKLEKSNGYNSCDAQLCYSGCRWGIWCHSLTQALRDETPTLLVAKAGYQRSGIVAPGEVPSMSHDIPKQKFHTSIDLKILC